MKKAYKKIGLSVVIIFATIVLLLATTPFLFQNKIIEVVKREVNNQLLTDVDFDKVKLSFIRNFPDASIHIDNLLITGRGDFANDTILKSKQSVLVVNIKSLFGDSGYDIKKFIMKDGVAFAHELKDGRVNWDIFPPDSLDTEESSFDFKLKNTQFLNFDVAYLSEMDEIAAVLKNSSLIVSGDLDANNTLLKTEFSTDAFSFWNENIQLTHDWKWSFNADIKANFNEDYYELAHNSMNINAIALSLNGWVKLLEEGMDMDLKMITDKVDFKSLLSLVPAIYSDSFKDLTAEGKVDFSGQFKGLYADEFFPSFDIILNVDDGRIKYNSLPKSIDEIYIASNITNPGGSLDNTLVDISKFSFVIENNPFAGSLKVVTPMSDPDFSFNAKGKLDLAMMKDVVPLEDGMKLDGLLQMDLDAAGKMSYVERNLYDKFRFEGDVIVDKMGVETKDLPFPVTVSRAELLFNNRFMHLKDLNINLGKNDLKATGKVENYLAYAMKDETLLGEMKLKSTYFNLNDFMGDSDDNDTTSMAVIEIPKNLNLSLNGDFNELQFDKMNFKNSIAQMSVKEGKLHINSMKTNAFGGDVALSGIYDALDITQPNVDFDVNLQSISFVKIMEQVQFLENFVPVFQKMGGTFSTKLKFNSKLTQDMSPVLSTIYSLGDFKTDLVTLNQNVEALNALMGTLKLNKLSNFDIKNLSVNFEIKDGALHTKPFNLNIKDYKLNLGGSTHLDQSIAYSGTISLPDNLNLKRFQQVGFTIGGTFTKPKISLDVMNTVDDLIQEKVAEQVQRAEEIKSELVNKGKEEVNKLVVEAENRANQIIANAKLQTDRLMNEAKVSADSIVSKANNPLSKALAQKAADEVMKQAQKKSDEIIEKARVEAAKLVEEAKTKTE